MARNQSVKSGSEGGRQSPASSSVPGQRLREAIEQIGREDAALISGKSVQQIYRYERGAEPPFSVVSAISKAAGVSLAWLAGGDDARTSSPAGAAPRATPTAELPLIDVELAAGGGAHVEGESETRVAVAAWLLRDYLGVQPAHAAAVYVRGDSMEPALHTGDLVLLDRSITTVQRDGIYAFRYDDVGFVKRLQQVGGAVRVKSDSPAYDDWEIAGPNRQRLTILARVAGVLQRA